VIELSAHLERHLPADAAFDWLLNCPGKVHREVKHRRTVEFEIGGRRFFVKAHRGCGWGEVLKDWLRGRAPIVSARSEWEAIEQAHALGIQTLTVAGKGERGTPPARVESFVITEAIEGMITLEDLTRTWGGLHGRRRALLKRALLAKVADIARRLHQAGLNHRDFYLCHVLVRDRDWLRWQPSSPTEDPLDLMLIDLHRAQRRDRVPPRWLLKDLAALLFSALDCGLTKRDLFRFLQEYRRRPWREVLAAEGAFWRRVLRRAERLYAGFHGRPPPRLALPGRTKAPNP